MVIASVIVVRTWRGSGAEASGRVVRVAWCGFRRERSSQHLTQGRVAQRVAQRPVRPQGFRDRGRVVLLPPQLLDQPLGLGWADRLGSLLATGGVQPIRLGFLSQ